jgi:hypothetical protein
VASSVRIKLNRAGIRELLRSVEVSDDLEARAERIASAAGPGHRVEVEDNDKRARAAVITDTFEARLAEAVDRNLTRAVDAGRDA